MKVLRTAALLLLASGVLAAALPPNLQKAAQETLSEAQRISFVAAFLGGMLSFLSPCILPILPGFFSYTFRERRELVKMTFVFFLGFTTTFVLLGVLASMAGQSLAQFQSANPLLIQASGALLILLGLLASAGKGLPVNIQINRHGHDVAGIYLSGLLLAVGWSACIGPVLAGILLVASMLPNVFYSASMLFVYSLGIFVPFFLLSLVSDRFGIADALRKHARYAEIVSGLLLIALGIVFIAFQGTSQVNVLDPLGTKSLFYSLQREIIGSTAAEILGALVLMATAALILREFLERRGKRIKK
ncbi:MAG: cytochrome c biogenesis CcdA family protein [Candidatus Micrarchaeia archaeon]